MEHEQENVSLQSDISFTRKTTLHSGLIRVKEIPADGMFDVKEYRAQNWIVIFLDKPMYKRLKKLADSKGLDLKKIMYGKLCELESQLSS